MALSTYAELKASVASWLNRTDLTTTIVDFITLTEADIRLDVRCQAMESLASGSLTGETLAHPTRYLESKLLYIDGDEYEYITPVRYLALDTSDTSKVCTSIGTNFYVKGGTASQTYQLVYYAGFAAFSADSDTNWILTNYPDVYLAGACRHGANFLKDFEAETRWGARYAGAVARVNGQQNRGHTVGQLRVIAR